MKDEDKIELLASLLGVIIIICLMAVVVIGHYLITI